MFDNRMTVYINQRPQRREEEAGTASYEESKAQLIEGINKVKRMISRRADFIEDGRLRDIYAVLLTAEGAIIYDDVKPLADICIRFCEERAVGAGDGARTPGP